MLVAQVDSVFSESHIGDRKMEVGVKKGCMSVTKKVCHPREQVRPPGEQCPCEAGMCTQSSPLYQVKVEERPPGVLAVFQVRARGRFKFLILDSAGNSTAVGPGVSGTPSPHEPGICTPLPAIRASGPGSVITA